MEPEFNCQSGVWAGGIKVNESACKWVVSPDAWVDPGQRQFYKTALCPTGYVQTGSRFMLWPGGLDDEHVDVYCCPFS
ncbi:pilus assembly protein PilV [Salmonella enterica]|nr:pilus assembly protein PilV [Salmonella enterica]